MIAIATGRLLEYYWKEEWAAVAGDFAEMKALGANTVRIHLQLSRFMKTESEVNPESLELLARVIRLAETNRLYLDITVSLGCYTDLQDVPRWDNDLNERRRWAVQERFWRAIWPHLHAQPGDFLLRPHERTAAERRSQRA